MQEAEIPSRLVPEPAPARPAVSPPLAFGILLAVIAAIGTIVFLTRPEAPAPPANQTAAHQPPDFSLTNEEAITRFEELNQLRVAMYGGRDLSLLDQFLASGSPLRQKAAKEVAQLLSDGVVPITNFVSEKTNVMENEEDRIVVRQVETDMSRFETETGKDITEGPAVIRRTVDWILVLQRGQWLLYDSEQVEFRVVKK